MYILITLILTIWTAYVGNKVSYGIWDTAILVCWISWPLYLTCILIFARQRGQTTKFWQFSQFADYLLAGAFIPLVLGISYFNYKLASNMQSEAMSFTENLLFVGYYSVILWGITGVSVFFFYLASKFRTKRNQQFT